MVEKWLLKESIMRLLPTDKYILKPPGKNESRCTTPPPAEWTVQSPSTRRPLEVPATQNVTVQMRNAFAPISSVVDDKPVAVLLEAEIVGDLGGLEQQVAEQLVVIRRRLGNAWNGFLGTMRT